MKRIVWLMAMTVVAAACGMGGDEEAGGGEAGADCEPGVADGDLNLYNWSEYIDPSLITQFEEEMGVAVTETFFDSNETMLAQIDAGGAAYDLIVPSDYMVQTMIEGELLIPLNRDAIPNLEQPRSRVHRAAVRPGRRLLGALPVGDHRASPSHSS